ncbi:MAG TPA: hypothetical protein ENN66_06355 [Proteobacteria bacterium]|nr:hypothetical protein [Pseudomonadota bacterium]
MGSVAGYLGYVNYREPWLGKALDYLLGAARQGAERLEITMPEGSTAAGLVHDGRSRLSRYASLFWGTPLQVEVLTRAVAGPELTLFPVANSKLWNQIVFFLPLDGTVCQDLLARGVAALVIGKKEYRQLQQDYDHTAGREVQAARLRELGAEFFVAADLPEMIDRVVPRARQRLGIVHLVSLCREERELLALDYACLRIKDFGSPVHEGPLQLRSLLGRLHAVFPGQFCVGLSLVHLLAS